MSGGRLGRFIVLTAATAGAVAVVRALRGPAAPQFSDHPSVAGGPVGTTLAPVPDPADASAPHADATTPEAEPVVVVAPAIVDAADHHGGESSWVAPVDGACPDGYPIKAKLSSGIFHQPGGLAYDRTKPDRCYPDAASAEADGLRAAKR